MWPPASLLLSHCSVILFSLLACDPHLIKTAARIQGRFGYTPCNAGLLQINRNRHVDRCKRIQGWRARAVRGAPDGHFYGSSFITQSWGSYKLWKEKCNIELPPPLHGSLLLVMWCSSGRCRLHLLPFSCTSGGLAAILSCHRCSYSCSLRFASRTSRVFLCCCC